MLQVSSSSGKVWIHLLSLNNQAFYKYEQCTSESTVLGKLNGELGVKNLHKIKVVIQQGNKWMHC